MTAQIIPFERPRPTRPDDPPPDQPAALPVPRSGRREYSLADIQRLLKMQDADRRTAIDALRKLAEQCGMPLPKTPRVWKGRVQTGPRSIFARSKWCALEMDAWLDRGLGDASPSPQVTRPDAPTATPATRTAMRDRALRIAASQ